MEALMKKAQYRNDMDEVTKHEASPYAPSTYVFFWVSESPKRYVPWTMWTIIDSGTEGQLSKGSQKFEGRADFSKNIHASCKYLSYESNFSRIHLAGSGQYL